MPLCTELGDNFQRHYIYITVDCLKTSICEDYKVTNFENLKSAKFVQSAKLGNYSAMIWPVLFWQCQQLVVVVKVTCCMVFYLGV